MPDFSGGNYAPPGRCGLATIGSLSWSTMAGQSQHLIASNAASAVYTLANYAIFVPFIAETWFTVYHLGWYNGTVVSGNVDCGIYNQYGTRLVSTGSTAQAGVSGLQIVNITDLAVSPGYYYMAFAMDNITGTVFRGTPALAMNEANDVREVTTGFPLPSTATMVNSTRAYIPTYYAFLNSLVT